jgi:6-phosphogluconolactonase
MWRNPRGGELRGRNVADTKPGVRVVADPEELAREGGGIFIARVQEALREKEACTVVLAGGSTPRRVYSLLAGDGSFRAAVPWEKVYFFFGDERHVPPDHSESNFRMANEVLLSKVAVPADHVHRIRGEEPDARKAAEEYEGVLRSFFRLKPGEIPELDFILLGMGADGHTASLFPGTEALKERNRLVAANWVPGLNAHRVTMTLPLLNKARYVLFLVTGEEKAESLRKVLKEKTDEALPAGLIRPTGGKCYWLVDRSAARLLKTL